MSGSKKVFTILGSSNHVPEEREAFDYYAIDPKAADVQRMKRDASREAADKAFLLMLGLPVMALHDKFGFGPIRCERFTDAVLELYDSFEKGYVTLDDIHQTLKEETGITIERKGKLYA